MVENAVKPAALIFGYGYLGRRIAARLIDQGQRVFAVTRSPQKANQMQEVEPIVADWSVRTSLRNLPEVAQVFVCVGWDRSKDQSQYDVYVNGLRNALEATSSEAQVIYVSSTGVYHQRDGSWVDERSPCRPAPRSGGWSHLRAEALLRRMRCKASYSILRMAGLYGPDRVPRRRDIAAGGELALPTTGFLNLIHIDDAADAAIAAAQKMKDRQELFVVSDGAPVIRETYYREIARIVNAPEPQFAAVDKTLPVSRRAITNKRIWNAKLRRELCPQLSFPNYKIGLRHILRDS